MNMGTLIRKYRKERKFTLKSVAKKANISEGFLSQVENNVNSPSVEKLMAICNAVGINAGDLLNQVEKQEHLVVIRKDEIDYEVDFPHTGFVSKRFFPQEHRTGIDSTILIIKPGMTIPGRKHIKNDQDIICIIKGSVELVYGERRIHLRTGDTVHYWPDLVKYQVNNNGEELAAVLWIGTI